MWIGKIGEEMIVAYSDNFPEKIHVILPKLTILVYIYIVTCPDFRD
jgi:hypothetical protein